MKKIAWIYIVIGAFLGALYGFGFPAARFELMLALGFLLAGMQTWLISVVVHSAYYHGHKSAPYQ